MVLIVILETDWFYKHSCEGFLDKFSNTFLLGLYMDI